MIARHRRIAALLSRTLSALKLPMAACTWVFASACFSTAQVQQIAPMSSPFLDGLGNKTVMFVSRSGSAPFCGGVYVDEHALLTANHCVDTSQWCTDDMGLSLTSCSGKDAGSEKVDSKTKRAFLFYTYDDHKSDASEPWIAVLIKHDERPDLALLFTRHAATSIATTAQVLPPAGDIAYVVGHPGGVPYAYLSAVVNGNHTRSIRKGRDLFVRHTLEINKRVEGGTSGGGAWNADGELIGICLSRSLILTESYFASAHEIRTFLAG